MYKSVAMHHFISLYIYIFQGRAVQTAQSLDEGLRSVISLRSTEVAFQENTNKLVHLTGPLRTDKVSERYL